MVRSGLQATAVVAVGLDRDHARYAPVAGQIEPGAGADLEHVSGERSPTSRSGRSRKPLRSSASLKVNRRSVPSCPSAGAPASRGPARGALSAARQLDDRVCGPAQVRRRRRNPLNRRAFVRVAVIGEHTFAVCARTAVYGIALGDETRRALALGERDVEVLFGLERDADQRHAGCERGLDAALTAGGHRERDPVMTSWLGSTPSTSTCSSSRSRRSCTVAATRGARRRALAAPARHRESGSVGSR